MTEAAHRGGRRLSWAHAEVAAVIAAGLAAGLMTASRGVNPFDEATVLVGAERVLAGEVPFRDFYALYPPGQYYTVAGLLSVFGAEVGTLRTYCVVVRALLALAIYLSARRIAGRALALPCWSVALLWLSFHGFYGYPLFPAMLLVLTSLGLSTPAMTPDAPPTRAASTRLFLAGLALGAAALFRHDVAFYGLVAVACCAAAALRRPSAPPGAEGAQRARPMRRVGAFAAGLCLAFVPPAAWMLASAPLEEIVFELVTYPSGAYAAVRGLPYPPLVVVPDGGVADVSALLRAVVHAPFYVAPVFLGAGVVWLGARFALRRRAPFRAEDVELAGLVVFGALAFNLARVRADLIHGVAALLPAYVVAAGLVRRSLARSRPLGLAAAAAAAVVTLLSLMWPLARFPGVAFPGGSARVDGAGATRRANGLAAGTAREEAAAFLRTVVPKTGRVFVGCGRHDLLFANEPIVYFLAERLPGSRYHQLDPGVVTTRAVQSRIVADLGRHRVEYLFLSTAYDHVREPNQSSVSSGVTDLDDYIRSHYAPHLRFGPHATVWKRTAPW